MAVMKSVTSAIVRRGIDAHYTYASTDGGHRKHGDESLLTPFAIATLAFTSVIFFITFLMVSSPATPLLSPTNISRLDTPTAISSPPSPWSRPPPPS